MTSDYSSTGGEVDEDDESIILTGGTEVSSVEWNMDGLDVRSFDLNLKPQHLGDMSPPFDSETEIYINGEKYGMIRTYHLQGTINDREEKISLNLGGDSTEYEISDYGNSFEFIFSKNGLELKDTSHKESLFADRPDQIDSLRIVNQQLVDGGGETEIEIRKLETQALITGCSS
jgi:hypothetical protein